jgi:hypothetical protein
MKANIAQAGGAVALLVMNDKEDLFKIVCSENDTFFDIKIPVVMIPKSEGESLQDHLSTGQKVDLLLYSKPTIYRFLRNFHVDDGGWYHSVCFPMVKIHWK